MELKTSFHYDGFESNFERDIKSVFKIDQLTDEITEQFWKACDKV